ncbi:toll/interleukin-1 receptor domain-containing protein [Roseomonas mucosa]|uniref:toll/interleukin-1 receptor domain-containing protein n=1 Tax=Roseomonas mucosa TaxID=207340 RepID=UPI0028CBE206|nr:toll/interleukin-1 receptor domain-containing protein [Roseomonas mucosa]MDT8316063.1 toll/interleukin-1 receptor domain-containing protein [Roseomonas mucosa]MDT8362593.1 toll/interleukin-1 receptor domain-containing protein [Roseomonas mucosa]
MSSNSQMWGSPEPSPANLFISYSHADEKALDRLHKHLAMLRRDGAIDAWTDHKILPGSPLDGNISAALNEANLFVALISPDYLASNYCYEKEFAKAQELAAAGRLRIVPVILEPCEWLASPFSQLMALPKDGKPISEWTNQNNAFLDVVTGLRRLIEEMRDQPAVITPGSRMGEPLRRPRIKQDFDTIQRSEYADKAFDAVRGYFQASCQELNEVGEGNLKARFETMSGTAFTCTVVNRARKNSSDAHITIRNAKQRGHFGDISYVYQPHAADNTSNGSVRVEADDFNLYLTMDSFSYSGRKESKYTPEQAAAALWIEFVKHAGIEYE